MQQPAACRTTLALWSALCALACGGQISEVTDGGIAQGGMSATGGWSSISTGGAMAMAMATAMPMAGTYGYTVNATGGTIARATGDAPAVTTTVARNCGGLTPPTATGSLSISSGYVATGILRCYGFTWIGDQSNANTCIVPVCGVTGCTPAFGSTALCAAGVVAADTSYNSIAGVGFNLNQATSGSNAPESISAPASITVETTFFNLVSGINYTGNSSARVQIIDNAGRTYCVDAGSWTSGAAIPISGFNTSCWDGMGVQLTSSTTIQSIHLILPSDANADRPFEFCLTEVSFN